MGRNSFCTFFHSHFTTFFKFGIIPNMGFYVGSALKFLSGICLNNKEYFKGKKLSGDTELAWFTFKWVGKKIMQNGSEKQLYPVLRRLWFVILTLSYSLFLSSSFICFPPHYICVL